MTATTNPPLTLQEGRYYRTRSGAKVGPVETREGGSYFCASGTHYTREGLSSFRGGFRSAYETSYRKHEDIVAEWTDEPAGPVITTTRTTTEIRPGCYSGVRVGDHPSPGYAYIELNGTGFTAPELRAASAVLLQLADGLDRIEAERNAK